MPLEVIDLWAGQGELHALVVSKDRKEDCGIAHRIEAIHLTWHETDQVDITENCRSGIICSNATKIAFSHSSGQPIAYRFNGELAGVYGKHGENFVLEEYLTSPSETPVPLSPETQIACDLSSDGTLVATNKINKETYVFEIINTKSQSCVFRDSHETGSVTFAPFCLNVGRSSFAVLNSSSLTIITVDGTQVSKKQIPLPVSRGTQFSISGADDSKCHVISNTNGKKSEIVFDL